MHLPLDEHLAERHATYRTFAREQVLPYADQRDLEQGMPRSAIRCLADAGYLGAVVSPEHGGLGLDAVSFGLLNAELGAACSSLRSILTVHSMVCQAASRWGSRPLQETWLPRLASGEALGAFALTEVGAGSDTGAVSATAREEGGCFVLDGHKRWITGGQLADVFLVFARYGAGVSAFLVERGTPGLRTTTVDGLLGVRASMVADVRLDGCRVPREQRIGPAAPGLAVVAQTALDLGRLSVAFGCVGIAQACVDASVAYAARRVQSGVPIQEHQLIRRLITRATTDVSAAWLLSLQAARERDSGDPDAVVSTLMAKYFASRVAMRTAADAVQIHGAAGCAAGHAVDRHFRDAKVMEIIEGSTQIQEVTIAEFATAAAAWTDHV